MSENIEKTLCMKLQTKSFSLQLDESTLLEMNRFFYPYVRFIDEGKVVEELLFAKELTMILKVKPFLIWLISFSSKKNSFAKFDCMCNRPGSCFNWTSQGISCLFEKGSF